MGCCERCPQTYKPAPERAETCAQARSGPYLFGPAPLWFGRGRVPPKWRGCARKESLLSLTASDWEQMSCLHADCSSSRWLCTSKPVPSCCGPEVNCDPLKQSWTPLLWAVALAGAALHSEMLCSVLPSWLLSSLLVSRTLLFVRPGGTTPWPSCWASPNSRQQCPLENWEGIHPSCCSEPQPGLVAAHSKCWSEGDERGFD